MRAMAATVLGLLAFLSLALGGCSEPLVEKPETPFQLPFQCQMRGAIWPHGDPCKGLCLAGSYKAGLDVVFVSQTGITCTRTTEPCTYRRAEKVTKATQLADTEKFLAGEAKERWLERISVALVGVEPATVRLVAPENDQFPMYEEMELKARELARRAPDPLDVLDIGGCRPIEEFSPRVLRTGNATLLRFEHPEKCGWDNQPMTLFISNEAFQLPDACYPSPFFFFVNDQLYLAYDAFVGCCNCSSMTCRPCVYDLSGATPKKVCYGPPRTPEEVPKWFMPCR